MESDLVEVAEKAGICLQRRNMKLVTAESITAGGIAHAVTSMSGSSSFFDRGFVTYNDQAKVEMLGVLQETLDESSAYNGAVVEEMAFGALKRSHADIAIAVSGIAGPNGGSEQVPVGTVFFCVATETYSFLTSRRFSGGRQDVRQKTITEALRMMIGKCNGHDLQPKNLE